MAAFLNSIPCLEQGITWNATCIAGGNKNTKPSGWQQYAGE